MVLKGRSDSVIFHAKVLSDAFSDAARVLTHEQRNRKTRGHSEPLVVEVKEYRSPAGAMEFDPPVTLRAGQERVGPRPPEGVHTAFLRKLSRPQCAPTLGGAGQPGCGIGPHPIAPGIRRVLHQPSDSPLRRVKV